MIASLQEVSESSESSGQETPRAEFGREVVIR
jgi:hypothetical protein